MRSAVPRRRGGSVVESAMTPMIDVIFQLQIFFLCSASFVKPESVLPTPLPPQGGATAKTASVDRESIRLSAATSGNATVWSLNGEAKADRAALVNQLRELAAITRDLQILFEIGPDVPLEEPVAVYDVCRQLGFEQLAFVSHAARP